MIERHGRKRAERELGVELTEVFAERTILTDLNHDWKLLVDEPDDPSLN